MDSTIPLRSIVGWKLDRDQREKLLGQFPPAYADVVADHVTLDAKADENTPLPVETVGEIVGEADDGKGVQAMVVRIGGTTDRPGGGVFHITWSLDGASGREAIESNDVIAKFGWRPLASPVPVRLLPDRFQ